MSEQMRHGAAEPLDLERLELLAKAATAGTRMPFDNYITIDGVGVWAEFFDPSGDSSRDTHFVAAFNPATALALIAALRAEQARVREAETATRHMSHCSFSTGIDGSLTAGRGKLSDNGYWQFPCEDCATRANYREQQDRERGAEYTKLLAEVRALREQVKGLEQRYRLRMWLNHGHGHPFLYGDDGEMQCHAPECRTIDFRRDSLDKIDTELFARAAISPSSDAKEPTP